MAYRLRDPISCWQGEFTQPRPRPASVSNIYLAGCAVEGHHPVVGVLFVLGGEEHGVTLSHGVEKVLATLEICEGRWGRGKG